MRDKNLIIGVDFSGAALAGEKIWISRAEVREGRLVFDFLEPAVNLPDTEAKREKAIPALVEFLKAQRRACIGFDFPFALTKENLSDGQSWRDWVLELPERFEESDAFRAAFVDAKRQADIKAKTPFSPLNLRLYRQTFHGLKDVLAPLLACGARAVPFEAAGEGLVLLEICPASLLKRENLYLSYKGKSEAQHGNRELILNGIAERFALQMSDEIRGRALTNTEGDALDAILAAVCVFKTEDFAAKTELDSFEGRVYF